MDISELEIPNTALVHIEFPGVGPLYSKKEDGKNDLSRPVTIEVYGPASNQAVEYKRKMMKEAQGLIAKKGMKAFGKRSVEETEQKDLDRLVALTVDVNNLSYRGQEITSENVETVYADPKMGWLTDQVRKKIGDWEDFLEE